MHVLSIASQALLWAAVLALGFLLLGLLRRLALLQWRLDEVTAVTPSRIGRDGLPPGRAAPDFALPSTGGSIVALADFGGRPRLVAFVQPGCGPCGEVVPALNAVHRRGEVAVIAVASGEPADNRAWAERHGAEFPVLVQQHREVARRYEVFATPYAFVVDEQGRIAAKGIVNNAQHVDFLLAGARNGKRAHRAAAEEVQHA